jgi:hypothetical protein
MLHQLQKHTAQNELFSVGCGKPYITGNEVGRSHRSVRRNQEPGLSFCPNRPNRMPYSPCFAFQIQIVKPGQQGSVIQRMAAIITHPSQDIKEDQIRAPVMRNRPEDDSHFEEEKDRVGIKEDCESLNERHIRA